MIARINGDGFLARCLFCRHWNGIKSSFKDKQIKTLKTAKAVNEDPACLYVGSHRRSNQPNLKNNDEKCKDYCKADTT